MVLLWGILAVSVIVNGILAAKVISMRKSADEIRTAFAENMKEDTNVGIDISCGDCKMKLLAADMDTQLKQLRKLRLQYENGDKELKDAVTNISHDLRTPLTALSGYLQLLDQEEVSDTVREYLKVMKNRTDAMAKLTEELFRYTLILSEESCENKEMVSLNRMLEDCIAGFYGALKAKWITPDVKMPETEVRRRLPLEALTRVLGNIIGNALKYSDGDLHITLTEEGCIIFSNHAKALDEVTVGRLLERFYTVENGGNATGLGLSIAQTLTAQMGGSIQAWKEEGMLFIELQFPEM